MDKELKQKWVDALRSGEYKQGKKRLKHSGRYCCLGVLCEVAGEHIPFGSSTLGQIGHLGLIGCSVSKEGQLACMNDDGKSFSEIADYIEANL